MTIATDLAQPGDEMTSPKPLSVRSATKDSSRGENRVKMVPCSPFLQKSVAKVVDDSISFP